MTIGKAINQKNINGKLAIFRSPDVDSSNYPVYTYREPPDIFLRFGKSWPP